MNPDDSRPRFPDVDYTKFSNGTLEAMMKPDQPSRQRVIAAIWRWSSGYQSPFMLTKLGKPAIQADIVELLERISSTTVSKICIGLKRDDQIRINAEGHIFPVPYPHRILPAQNVEIDPYVDLPNFEDYIKEKEPELLTEKAELRAEEETVLNSLYAIRKRKRKIEGRLRDLAEEMRKSGIRDPVVPVSGTNAPPIPISKENCKETIVSECFSVAEGASATEQVRAALTHHFGFFVADNDAIPAELVAIAKDQNLSLEELDAWMAEKAQLKAKQRYKVASPGAVRDWAKQDLGPWAKENAGLLEAYRKQTAAPPEPELTPEREIDITIRFIGSLSDHPECPAYVERLRQLAAKHPELVQSLMRQFESEKPDLAAIVQGLLDGEGEPR